MMGKTRSSPSWKPGLGRRRLRRRPLIPFGLHVHPRLPGEGQVGRSGEIDYQALIASGYRKDDDGWRLVFHQRTHWCDQGPVFIVGAPGRGVDPLPHPAQAPVFCRERPEERAGGVFGGQPSRLGAPLKPPRPRSLWLYFLGDEAAYSTFCDEVRKLTGGVRVPDGSARLGYAGAGGVRAPRRRGQGCQRMLEKTPPTSARRLAPGRPADSEAVVHPPSPRRHLHVVPAAGGGRPQATWADLSVEEFAEIYRRQGASPSVSSPRCQAVGPSPASGSLRPARRRRGVRVPRRISSPRSSTSWQT